MALHGFVVTQKHVSFAVTSPVKFEVRGKEVEAMDGRFYLVFGESQKEFLNSLSSTAFDDAMWDMATWAAVFIRDRMNKFHDSVVTSARDNSELKTLVEDLLGGLRAVFGSPKGDFATLTAKKTPETSLAGLMLLFGFEPSKNLSYGETDKKNAH